ncbi:Cadherin-18 [Liparis tanakae]|uniref:Cadherin-18 n=1 Tax=Liparis tanakae TaxID=230148 RepID=A0A4Z2GMF0_9TELE|nr:Cadherin-18 [Liparis tanakae]
MRIPATSCLCPFLVCLCFIQRCCAASHHLPAKAPSRNLTRLANGGLEVHHRPKRGWIWNHRQDSRREANPPRRGPEDAPLTCGSVAI